MSRKRAGEPPNSDRLRGMIEEAIPAAQERAELVGQMRDALLAGDDAAALRLARKVCGLPAASGTHGG